MKHLKMFFLGALLSVLYLPVLAQDERNYDAVYHSIVKEYTLNRDGSTSYRFVKEQKLLTYRAINNMFGETFVVYNPQHQVLEINECRTTMADGKVIKAPSNAFNEVLPGFAANAPACNILREMVITHTGLERNAVIRLDYTIRSDKGYYPALAGNELLSETEPVKSLTIRVRVPAGQELNYRVLNLRAAPDKSTENDMTVYTWKIAGVPVISAEENQAGGNERYPRLIFSTSADAASAWAGFFSQEAFKGTVTPDMTAAVEKLTSSVSDKALLALKIQEKVVNEVNLTPVPMRYSGFRLRTPAQVGEGSYGTLPEKALLLSALLNQAGIPAYPAAVLRASAYDGKIADLSGIEEMIVKAEIPGGDVMWLSAAALNPQDLSRTLDGKAAVCFTGNGKVSEARFDAKEAAVTLKGNLFVSDKNEMTGEVSASLTGPANPQYALKRDSEKARQWFGGGVASRDLKEAKLSQAGPETANFAFDVKKENALKKDSILRIFTLPSLTSGAESWNLKLLPSYRNSPLEIPFAVAETTELTVTIPDGMTMITPENDFSISNAAGSFRYVLKKEAGKIMISRELKVPARIIEPKAYAGFKALMDNYNALQTKEVVFIVK